MSAQWTATFDSAALLALAAFWCLAPGYFQASPPEDLARWAEWLADVGWPPARAPGQGRVKVEWTDDLLYACWMTNDKPADGETSPVHPARTGRSIRRKYGCPIGLTE